MNARERIGAFHAVLQANKASIGTDHGPRKLGRLFRLEQFHGEQYEIDVSDLRRIVRRKRVRDACVPVFAFDAEPGVLNCLQMCTSRNESYVLACFCEPRAKISADRARTEYAKSWYAP